MGTIIAERDVSGVFNMEFLSEMDCSGQERRK